MPRAVLSSLLCALAACAPRQAATDAPEPPAEPPQVVLHGVHLRSYEGSTLAMTGEATRVTWLRVGGEATASQAVIHLQRHLAVRGAPGGMEIHAPLLEGTLASRQLTASGGVELRSPTGMVARTPRAAYDGASRGVSGHEGVEVQGPGYGLRADSFSLSLADETFSFDGSVHTVLGAARD